MRTARAFALVAMLAFLPLCVFGDGTVSPPNPVGEKLWYAHLRTHFLTEMLPFAIIVGAFLLAGIIHVAHRKTTKLVSPEIGSYDI